jgi:hypothetical protein
LLFGQLLIGGHIVGGHEGEVCGGESEVARALGFDAVGSLNLILLFPTSPVELAESVYIHERQAN